MSSLRNNQLGAQRSGDDASEHADPRDAQLDAARACILDVGWRRTTLTEVARRSGVSRMTIYRRWSDMSQLLGDLMTREWADVVRAVTGAADEPDRVARLGADLVRTVQALRANELFVRIIELDPELILPYLLARRGRSQDAILVRMEHEIRSGQESGEIRPADPTTLARSVLLAAHGFVLSAQTMVDDDVTGKALDRELERLVVSMLAS